MRSIQFPSDDGYVSADLGVLLDADCRLSNSKTDQVIEKYLVESEKSKGGAKC